jgi:Alcohol dehydrogenase GroES-like domain
MFGMVLHETGRPLVFEELPDPVPGPGELRVRVEACGVCRTDLHVVDGELPDPKLPIIPGHERSAFPGLGRPAASAPIARATGRTSATGLSSRVTRETAVTRPTLSPTRAMLSS